VEQETKIGLSFGWFLVGFSRFFGGFAPKHLLDFLRTCLGVLMLIIIIFCKIPLSLCCVWCMCTLGLFPLRYAQKQYAREQAPGEKYERPYIFKASTTTSFSSGPATPDAKTAASVC